MADFGLNTNGKGGSSKSQGGGLLVARVTKVLLSNITKEGKIDQDFVVQGGYASIGAIKYTLFQNGETVSNETKSNNFALPLFSNIKQYPLVGEIVLLVPGPSSGLNESAADKKYFYLTTVNLWNSQHHNAFPDLVNYSTKVQQQISVEDIASGQKKSTSGVDIKAKLGDYFHEKGDINPLLPFEGDFILEGRWGQSIRFGSTSTEQKNYNKWSVTGSNGDPITVITNKRYHNKNSTEAWIPSAEDINKDGSSIWLTGGQSIDMDVSSYPLDTFRLGYRQNYGPQTTLPISNVSPGIATIAAAEHDKQTLDRL